MGFAGSGAADENRIGFGVEESTGGEFANLPFIDRRISEDKLVVISRNLELGSCDAITDRARLMVSEFSPQQVGARDTDSVRTISLIGRCCSK
ncbi:hypothetical protein QEV83_10955 [Methylocapsa sp. D3K7]|uniref:hypothetical protein n=1 Tax=Methylocapsa sp. D3K7 TaxID=3041435 RepID=UPI00244E6543|nr:hypothetical protein [Methylocapsa sp. D3K7]WGJ13234.1 hypothetical protein QEV83_10955 [Methylocapsa sp. D3K7]